MQVFWHRSDLRTADNRGLHEAATTPAGDTTVPAVLPVFCLDPDILEHASDVRVTFMLDALRELRDQYRAHGGDLLVRRGPAESVIPSLATEVGADRVVWNRDYSGLARARDDAVRERLVEAGVDCASYHDAVLHDPDAIRTNEGDPYQVYSYYWRKWRDRPKDDPFPDPDAEALADPDTILDRAVDSVTSPGVEDAGFDDLGVDDLGFDEPDATIPDAGTTAARERLADFLAADVYRYADARDRPAAGATSRISQDLAFGTIGIREVYAAVGDARSTADSESARESVTEYASQLAWREFYTQVLAHNPSVVTENYTDFPNPIEWRNDPDELAAWKAGRTGYPIVDAGMRQLRAEAYMHNRVRMIVASFLTKDLLWDWRAGYAHFRDHLVDHDTANDTGGWQWAASTGTDAQPYFRIFNPTTQGERYDPDATYIGTYVPELQAVDADVIHQWPDIDPDRRAELAPEYPDPIVDHAVRREAALDVFEAARADDD